MPVLLAPGRSLTEALGHGGQVFHTVAAHGCGGESEREEFSSLLFSSLLFSSLLSALLSRASGVRVPLISVPPCLRASVRDPSERDS